MSGLQKKLCNFLLNPYHEMLSTYCNRWPAIYPAFRKTASVNVIALFFVGLKFALFLGLTSVLSAWYYVLG